MSKKVYEITVFDNGVTEWRLDGRFHREDGPAVTYNDGTKLWYKSGYLHREDGPAAVYPDGTKSWYLDGVYLSKSNWKKKVAASKDPCSGRTVEIDGKKYKLTAVE